tara:strand:- start:2560 stop:3222 length:663 start_codon:yes stop_codon:yes gene_type:complete
MQVLNKEVNQALLVLSAVELVEVNKAVDCFALANGAELKKAELIHKGSKIVSALLGVDYTIEKWKAIYAEIENRLVNAKKILPSTAKNYLSEMTKILRAGGLEKPKSQERTALIKSEKAEALEKKYSHASVENLSKTLTALIGKTDKASVNEFKEVSQVIMRKTSKAQSASDKQTKEAQSAFTKRFMDKMKSIVKNDPAYALYLETNLVQYEIDFKASKN